MKYLFLCAFLLLTACSTSAPKIIAGRGAVYGVVSAGSHPDLKNNRPAGTSVTDTYMDDDEGGELYYQGNLIDYSRLKEIYVGLISADYRPQLHHVYVEPNGIYPYSLALSPNDTLHIHNNTTIPLNFYITGLEDKQGFQSFPELKAGEMAFFKLKLEGRLELLSEEDEKLKVHLLAKENMLSQKLSSGQNYRFERLRPGDYQLIFWYWRLGEIREDIHIKAQENISIDKTLTVDSVMQSN
ncbi:MAG: hypothetical protein KAJ63_00010 [Methyloprofundus sp.]|nr:hypothetical protein [Methyloprofundus sp.]